MPTAWPAKTVLIFFLAQTDVATMCNDDRSVVEWVVDESDDSGGHGGGSRCETAPRFGINKVAQRSDLGERKDLSFGNIFVDEMHTDGGDDHFSFLKRGVAASDLVDYISYPYWYTPQDAMDKIDPAGMQAARQRLLEVLPALEERRE
jgi:peptidase M28-like protein